MRDWDCQSSSFDGRDCDLRLSRLRRGYSYGISTAPVRKVAAAVERPPVGMKILFVARRYWPARGGIESFLRHMATELSSRHDLTVLAGRVDDGPHTRLNDSLRPPPGFDTFVDAGAIIKPLNVPTRKRLVMTPLIAHVTPGLRRYAYGRSRRFAAALVAQAVGPIIAKEASGMDVIHMWSGDLLASAAVHAGHLARVPVVITPFAHEGQWGYDAASVRAYRAAERLGALLDGEAEFYARLGVDRRRIEICGVCSPGVEAVDRHAARRRLGIRGRLVLFLGARRPYKGFDLLLQASPAVTAVHRDASFAFVGPGPRLADVPRESNVLDIGPVADEERAVWLNAADVLCLPSQAEILPVSILEAWSVATPVLTSDIPALEELVASAGGGRCIPRDPDQIAEALIKMLADPGQLQQMGLLGRHAWLGRYTPEAVARRHEDLYARACSARAVGWGSTIAGATALPSSRSEPSLPSQTARPPATSGN